ncbi:hypothetical protein D3C87_1928660 [compost metagenome]
MGTDLSTVSAYSFLKAFDQAFQCYFQLIDFQLLLIDGLIELLYQELLVSQFRF